MKRVPCSVGLIVPASMFIYGSILIAVTFRPVVLSKRPVEDAVYPFNHAESVQSDRRDAKDHGKN